jgi:hypothetical protein
MDEFPSHMTEKVRMVIYVCDMEINFIIDGYTSKLQTMDVELNQPFKDEYWHQFEACMVTSTTGKPHQQQDGAITTDMILNTWWRVLSSGNEGAEIAVDSKDDESNDSNNNKILYMDMS